ncbi:MAG: (d)CMP kinase [Xanthobacteraceae bacterium]|uniref:(d)CMP kinase n=1 Tax=Pseudolabrys sp. TaxID=1960880 RepID=UPI003D10D17B
MIIAIDGPAASGKGTLAKRLAAHYGFHCLDTGLLYRAVALSLLEAGQAPSERDRAEAAARTLDLSRFPESALKAPKVSEAASIVSAIPEVRTALLAYQKDFVARLPGAVLDGRDIGTVIAPQAEVKIFVTANPEVRARRRFLEMQQSGGKLSEAEVLADIRRRDERDSSRGVAPLKIAPDAHLLDTTAMDADAVLRAAIAIVENAK